jgi:hypothetical protein
MSAKLAPSARNTDGSTSALGDPQSALVLSAPIGHTAYQIHPGLPQAHQRIEVGGYVADGRAWFELHLVKDGAILASASGATRLNTWWTIDTGEHRFWVEGKPSAEDELVRSTAALVVVEPFELQPVAGQNLGQ